MPSRSTAPPAADKNLPSFQHPLYVEVADDLQWAIDCWNELKDCKANYLPKEEKEPDQAYTNRLTRSQFDSRFAPALRGHAGLLSEFTLTGEAPQTVRDYEKNIDQQGNSLTTFLTEVDEMVLRDGGCGILVEYPPEPKDEQGNPLIQSAADEQAFEMRPYLVAIDRRDIINWDIEYVQGKPFIKFAVIREHHLVPDGEFGCEPKTYYRVLRPGSFEVYELEQSNGKWRATLHPELSGETNLDRVPLVWYSISNNKILQGNPPFLNLAKLNVEHFQKRSSLNEVLHKCNMPVPVRKGLIKSVQDLLKPVIKLVIGPNSVVDIPSDGDFYFAEPTGNAIAATQADIEKLEDAMDRMSLAFLSGGEVEKTATQALLDSAQIGATLKSMQLRKRSAVEQIFDLWIEYTGEKTAGSIEVSAKMLQLPPNPQDIGLILDAMGVKISNRLGLEMLLQRGWLPQDTDIDAEAALSEAPPEPVAGGAIVPPQPEPELPIAA